MGVLLTRAVPVVQPISETTLREIRGIQGLVAVTVDSDSTVLTLRYDLSQTCIEQIVAWLRRRGVHPKRLWFQRLCRGRIQMLESPSGFCEATPSPHTVVTLKEVLQ